MPVEFYERELIDTQWDVNTDPFNGLLDVARINRYIVGCK